jgi:hypothetical protein
MFKLAGITALTGILFCASLSARADDANSADAKTLGKYLCFVSHKVGISYTENGRQYGNFQLSDNEFFVTISRAKHLDVCKTNTNTTVLIDLVGLSSIL